MLIWGACAVGVCAAEDGAGLYAQHCAMCHQAEGQGVAGIFPPLARADFLVKERERAIRAPLEGLTGTVTVNGTHYNSAMPMVALNDVQTAAVMNYVFTSWGNDVPRTTEEEVATVRTLTKYPTWQSLAGVHAYAPPPPVGEGWSLVAGPELPFKPVRLALRRDTREVYILAASGAVWAWHPQWRTLHQILVPGDYIREGPGLSGTMCLGLMIDRSGRLWISGNQTDKTRNPVNALVSVWRTAQPLGRGPVRPELWLQTRYPRGVGGFNHGVSCLTEGPDGMVYLSSGSRTDGNEPGKLADHYQGGEVPLTSCIWRLDPQATEPLVEVWCQGLRNAYGLAWDGAGRLWASENGPDADRPEELNLLTVGAHYGFPFQYAHFPLSDRPYAHTPLPPAGQVFTPPVMNEGPAAGGSAARAIGTFDPHSCPSGMIWVDGPAYAPADRGTFFVTRYGNLLAGKDGGFDLVRVRVRERADRTWRGETSVVAGPLARPIDVLEYAPGTILIAEYSRGLNFAAGIGQNGRMLILKRTAGQ